MEVYGSTGLCSVEISRTSKGDYTYTLKTYFSAKGTAPDAAIARADKLRRELERRLGLLPDSEAGEEFTEGEIISRLVRGYMGQFDSTPGSGPDPKLFRVLGALLTDEALVKLVGEAAAKAWDEVKTEAAAKAEPAVEAFRKAAKAEPAPKTKKDKTTDPKATKKEA